MVQFVIALIASSVRFVLRCIRNFLHSRRVRFAELSFLYVWILIWKAGVGAKGISGAMSRKKAQLQQKLHH